MNKRFFLPAAVALIAVCPFAARCEDNPAPRPVSVQELALLLRSGYTGDEALKETAGRPLLAPIDASAERTLLDAGADARTIAALRADRRVASAMEADGARQQQAAANQFKLEAWEADQARRKEIARQTTNTKLAARRDEQLRQVATGLRDKLVICKDNHLGPYDNTVLAGKRLFLLYGAGPDKASRQWTPQMVEFYNKFVPTHPGFEVVLVSAERSAADMEKAMKGSAMPWPALALEQLAQQSDLATLVKEGLPRLVLIDGSGAKLADNLENGKLLSPQRVLDTLTAKTTGTASATTVR